MKKWLSKWLTGFCVVGVMIKIYKYQEHTKCQRCNQDNETVGHIVKYTYIQAWQLWYTSLDEVRTWMIANQGHPELCKIIYNNLRAWNNSISLPGDTHKDGILQEAQYEQDIVG